MHFGWWGDKLENTSQKWHFILVPKKMGRDQLDKGRSKSLGRRNGMRKGVEQKAWPKKKTNTANAQNVKMREDKAREKDHSACVPRWKLGGLFRCVFTLEWIQSRR